MSKVAKAKLRWLTSVEGWRASVPSGPIYSTAARFEHDAKGWPNELWSLVVHLDESWAESKEGIATVELLVDRGQDELLDPGNSFELLEGERVVARGEVIE